ncbi:MAG: HEPN domain-containing protein, partial [Chloroflexota bacterium]|nr:HEPN domain-containing protein [Chloroflexota bacterium]
DGDFYGVAVNRAYYAFFYAATALLLTLDLTRSKHSGVMVTFRQYFVKPGTFSVRDSHAYGEAFELRNITDYEMMGKADDAQAHAVVENATHFVERCETYLITKGYL